MNTLKRMVIVATLWACVGVVVACGSAWVKTVLQDLQAAEIGRTDVGQNLDGGGSIVVNFPNRHALRVELDRRPQQIQNNTISLAPNKLGSMWNLCATWTDDRLKSVFPRKDGVEKSDLEVCLRRRVAGGVSDKIQWWSPEEDAARPARGAGQVRVYLQSMQEQEYCEPDKSCQSLRREINALVLLLDRMYELDSHLAGLPEQGPGQVRKAANQHRAAAWLHAWAVFGRLARIVSDPQSTLTDADREDLRERLLSMDSDSAPAVSRPSALAYLLAIHRQLFAAGKEQQLTVGKQVPNFSALWPSGIENDAPCVVEPKTLWGSPSDQPANRSLPADMLSFWQLINLQLDTWHNWSATAKADNEPPSDPGLGSLGAWLEGLAKNPDLELSGKHSAAGGGPDKASNPAGETSDAPRPAAAAEKAQAPNDLQRQRVEKLAQFVKFRQEIASDRTKLANLVNALRDDRLRQPKGPTTLVPGLAQAAMPLEDGEYLPDAAIWLRYLVLLSYQGDGGTTAVGHGKKTLEKYWKNCDRKPFVLEQPKTDSQRRASPSLRWAKWPPKGHSADVLNDLTATTYELLNFQQRLIEADRRRYDPENQARNTDPVKELKSALTGRALLAQAHKVRKEVHAKKSPSVQGLVEAKRAREEAATQFLRGAPGWLRSVTKIEEKEIAQDFAELTRRLESILATHDLLKKFKLDDPCRPGLLAHLAGTPELADLDLNQSPARTLEEHVQEIKKLAGEGIVSINKEELHRRLRRNFEETHDEVLQSDLEFQAAQFAYEAAQHALEAARIYENIVELDRQIAVLLEQASQEKLKAAELAHRSAGIKLMIATRARDLAAAELAALEGALRHAQDNLIPKAREGILRLQEEARNAAGRSEKARTIGFLKIGLNILGAALAPLTGGLSMQIAVAANALIDVADRAGQMDWGNLGQIVQNIGQLIQQPAPALNTVANVVGIQIEPLQFITDVAAPLQAAIKKGRPLIDDAQEFVKGIASQRELAVLTQLVAQGVSLKLERDQVTAAVDLGNMARIAVQDEALRKLLTEIVSSGNVIAGDLENRIKSLSELPLLKNEDLKKALKEAAPEIVKAMPSQVRNRMAELGAAIIDVQEVQKRVENWIDQTNQQQLEVFAQLLGSGAIITLDQDNNLLIIERPVKAELNAMKARAEALAKDVATKAINEVLTKIEQARNDLQNAIAAAERQQNPGELRRIADEVIPKTVKSLCGDGQAGGLLQELHRKIEEARARLEDKQLAADAAGLDEAAQAAFVRAQKYTADAEAKGLEKAPFLKGYAKADLDSCRALVEEKARRLDAARLQWDRARRRLEWAYQDCLRAGIDPTKPEGQDKVAAAPPSLAGVLLTGGTSDQTPGNSLRLRQAVREYMGVLQWGHLLFEGAPLFHSVQQGKPITAEAKTEYRELLNRLASLSRSDSEVVRLIEWLADRATEIFNTVRETAPHRAVCVDGWRIPATACAVFLFENEKDRDADPWLRQLPANARKNARMRVTFRIVSDAPAEGAPGWVRASNFRGHAFCVVSSAVALVSKQLPHNCEYVLLPPEDGTVLPPRPPLRPARMLAVPTVVARTVKAEISERDYLAIVQQTVANWATRPDLYGAYGEWNIYLFHQQPLKGDGVDFSVYVPHLRWQPGTVVAARAPDNKLAASYALLRTWDVKKASANVAQVYIAAQTIPVEGQIKEPLRLFSVPQQDKDSAEGIVKQAVESTLKAEDAERLHINVWQYHQRRREKDVEDLRKSLPGAIKDRETLPSSGKDKK